MFLRGEKESVILREQALSESSRNKWTDVAENWCLPLKADRICITEISLYSKMLEMEMVISLIFPISNYYNIILFYYIVELIKLS